MRTAEIIKEERAKRGLTLQRLADKSGVEIDRLVLIERGTVIASEEELFRICEEFGMSTGEFKIYALELSDFKERHRDKMEKILPAMQGLMRSIRKEADSTKEKEDEQEEKHSS